MLERDLPPIQQAVIHVRQSKTQMKLYRAFKTYQAQSDNNNFLDQYSKLFPVNNHPGTLLFRNKDRRKSKDGTVISEIVNIEHSTSETAGPAAAAVKKESKYINSPITAAVPIDGTEPVNENSQGSVEVIVIDDSDDDDGGQNDGLDTLTKELPEIDDLKNALVENNEKWWEKVYRKNPDMAAIQNGGKVLLLLQILAHSESIGKS